MKNWLKNISDETLLCNINIPGTHNSCACFIDFPYFSKCQNLTIKEQLEIGIRFFDLRIEAKNGEVKTVHSILSCRKKKFSRKKLTVDDVLFDITSFLKENTTETVLLCVKRDNGVSPEETYRIFFERYVKNNDLFFTENRIAALGEVRGKTVLINRCEVGKFTDLTSGLNLSNWPDQTNFDNSTEKENIIIKKDGLQRNTGYFLQDFYTLPKKQKWQKAILPAIENAHLHKDIVINFFSANNGFSSPKMYKKYIYRKFDSVKLKKRQKYGWIILDFPEKEVTEKIINSNFM